jgi:secreted PhoX family phosphatase
MTPMTAATTETGGSPLQPTTDLFQFSNVPISVSDTVVVPQGYTAEPLFCWGDPIDGTQPAFRFDASNSADDQARQGGMGHDGMEYFEIPGFDPNERGLLCVNHEYTDQVLLFPDGIEPLPPTVMPLEKVRKSQAAHGVSIVELARQGDGHWTIIPSTRARRITANTPMRISGPACPRVGERVAGTVNNCAAGRTPWGTYLTCEENFQGVFGTDSRAFEANAEQKRYGLEANGYAYKIDGQSVPVYRWWQQDPRFDLSRPECDAERFGYVVEIDPLAPEKPPVKRTALGRFRHENAEVTLAADGRVVVYMGDDQADEFLYKYVSRHPYAAEKPESFGLDATGGLLDDGTLYAARFQEDGRGEWLPLDETTGLSAAEVAVFSRIAASQAGATPMDRPEWVAVHPQTGEVFVSLTNHARRTQADAANPRVKNIFGHILRWQEDQGDAAARSFSWRVFLMAGNPDQAEPTRQGNVMGDAFACPDGLKFDASGILWIQTDMSSSVMGNPDFAALGNNMMLAADPTTGQVRRFLTGPKGCEITGMSMTPDRRTLFVNIQHPGEPADEVSDPGQPNQYSNWPDGRADGRPRSATVVIRRSDGQTIGT